MSYNHLVKKFVFVEYKDANKTRSMASNLEVVRIFHFNFNNLTFGDSKTGTYLNTSYEQRIIKIQMSSDRVLFALTADKRLVTYQVGRRIERIKSQYSPDIIGFDVYDNKYFLIYNSHNVVELYSIDMLIYRSYKLRLPYYKDYEGFKFTLFNEYNQYLPTVIRTYRNDAVAFLLHEQLPDGSTGRYMIMIYCLETFQHNSFILANDFTDLFTDSSYMRILLTGDEAGRITLGAMS